MKYIFPYQLIEKDCKIILYGAGKVGYDFFRQIKTTDYCEIVAWVDQQYEWCRCMNLPVESPAIINEMKWDKIVLAVEFEQTANSIRRYLNDLDIAHDKIVYADCYLIGHDIVKKYSSEAMRADANEAYQCHPGKLLSEKRLDFVIRYLYAKELIKHENGGIGEKLYTKFIDEFCGAEEGLNDYLMAYFTEYKAKKGLEAFKNSFKKLVESIVDNGFWREGFVPLDINGQPFNGTHRLAVALAMNKPIWVRKYPYKMGDYFGITVEWLSEHGFTDEEIKIIYDNYIELVRE